MFAQVTDEQNPHTTTHTNLVDAANAAGSLVASVIATGVADLRSDEAADSIVALEQLGRRVQAAQVALLTEIETSRAYAVDGHFSARVMMRHHGRLSGSEASQRHRTARALRDLPKVAAAWQAGRIGTDQVRCVARTWSNPRIRHLVCECDHIFVEAAEALEYCDFDSFCREWEEAADADGAHRRAERRWERRSINLSLDFNGTWDLRARMTSIHGARFHDLLARRTKFEQLRDSEAAKELHGNEWRNFLPRTLAQIRYDVFTNLVFGQAHETAGAAGATGATGVITNIVIDQQSFEQQLAALVGAPIDPIPPDEVARSILNGSHFCHTLDNTPVSTAEVVAEALIGRIRRVVINSAGVVTDVGRTQRLFTGSSRLSAMLQATRCYWHGCWIPATHCEIDHLTSWNDGGATKPANGAPACGGHNHLKEAGYRAVRRPGGEIEITRPDGRPTPDHLTAWQASRGSPN